jgi:general secretion pathway protein I
MAFMTRSADASGFTLIEVLIAFTIAALLLLPLLHSFSMGISSATRTGGFTEATLIAESTLESMGPGIPLVDGAGLDQQEGAYHVSASVHRYQGDGAPDRELLLAIPYEVVVTVSWPEAATTRAIALRTLRIGPPPAQEQTPP